MIQEANNTCLTQKKHRKHGGNKAYVSAIITHRILNNARFYLILLLLSLLFGTWTYLAHNHGKSVHACYDELALLPVYANVADTTAVGPSWMVYARMTDLAGFEHEPDFKRPWKLIEAYGLPLTDATIASYEFPDLITVKFPADPKGILAKEQVMSSAHHDPRKRSG